MIPTADISPTVPSPTPASFYPESDEITEEGFGGFRGTWFIGRAFVEDANVIVHAEGEMLDWLDRLASSAEEFESLAVALECADASLLSGSLHQRAVQSEFDQITRDEEFHPLAGLEIGVAGLTYALSVVGCLTAASCRSHATDHSWADCPVVLFAARAWRIELLVPLITLEGCGLQEARGMLVVYGQSVRDTHRLACRILAERARFRRKPDHGISSPRRPQGRRRSQLRLM